MPAGCGQRLSAKPAANDDPPKTAESAVIGLAMQRFDTDVGLPHMLMAGGHLDVRAQ